MITYKDIYDAAKKERYSESLQLLSKTFLKDFATYIKEKKEAAEEDKDMFSESLLKTKKQLENAITLFQEIMRRRKKKILNLILIASETGISKQDFNNMLSVEKELFEDVIKCVEKSDKKINKTINGEKSEESQKHELVVFLEDVKDIMGFDGERVGSFEKGQIANIPKEVSKILIEDGKVESV
jgi:DNA replication initiation complex subunit (GINS family)